MTRRLPLLVRTAPCLLAAALAGGCGGSEDLSTTASVVTLAATPVAYSRPMTVTVNGRAMLQGVQLSVDDGACGPVSKGATNTNETQQFICQVLALGDITVRVRNTEGLELATLSLKVPPPQVSMTVTQGANSGSFVLDLDPTKAPATVLNFLAYVNSGFYTNVIFHRVVAGFVVQAGGYTAGPAVKAPTRPAIALESNKGLANLRGTIGMARTSAPDSATSQFYINLADNPDLDYKDAANPGYAVFGSVASGLDVVDAIGAVPVRVDAASGLANVPVTDVVITAASQSR